MNDNRLDAENDFQRWLLSEFSDKQILSIALHGCDRGTPGIAYFEQTSEIYNNLKNILWEILVAEKKRKAPGKMMLEWFAVETCKCAIPGSYTNDDGDITRPEKFEQRVVWYCARLEAKNIVRERELS